MEKWGSQIERRETILGMVLEDVWIMRIILLMDAIKLTTESVNVKTGVDWLYDLLFSQGLNHYNTKANNKLSNWINKEDNLAARRLVKLY